jgi:predicted permease
MRVLNWFKRLAASLREQRLEQRLDSELQFHLEMRTRENCAAGGTPEQARSDALRRFGSLTRTMEECRDMDTLTWIGTTKQDVRYAFRAIRNAPGFTAAAVLCLAVGIAANTTVFSFVNAFLLRPLPVRHPEQIVIIGRAGGEPASYAEYLEWKNANEVFSGLAGYTPEALTVGQASEPALGEVVTAEYFETFEIRPLMGRLVQPGEDDRPLAVISDDLWRRRFSSDPGICGRAISINHETFTVTGVVPRSFPGMLSPWSTDLWVTAAIHPDGLRDRNRGLSITAARLKPGANAAQAQAAMTSLDSEWQRLHPDPEGRKRGKLFVRNSAALANSPMWGALAVIATLLMAVVAVVFAVACANVAGLLMARYLVRRREIAIRLSMGASRSRLIRQFLTETALLSLLGGSAGTAMAYFAGGLLAGMLPASISSGFQVQHGMDWRVLAFTLALSFVSVLLCGVLPALRFSDQNLAQPDRGGSGARKGAPRLRQILAVGQVALSVLALVVAGLFVRSVQKAQTVDLGFEPGRVLTAKIDLRDRQFPPQRRAEFYRQVSERVGDLPGVEKVSLSDTFPLGNTRTQIVTARELAPMEIASSTVDADYFETMGIRLVRGRNFLAHERNTVIVNEAMARRFWPNQDTIGKTILLRRGGPQQAVVGIAKDGKYWSLGDAAQPFLYLPFDRASLAGVNALNLYLLVRTAPPPEAMIARVREAIQKLDPDLPGSSVRTANGQIQNWLEPARAGARLLSILGTMALALALTGVYGLLAQLVAQRTPEIAIRVALGASRRSVVAMVFRQSGLLLAAGVALGIAGAAVTTRLSASLISGVGAMDVVTLAAVAAVMILTGIAATLVPAYRAVRIQPAQVLRAE